MVRTLGAHTLDVDFVKIGFTGHTDFTVVRYSAACSVATVDFDSAARESTCGVLAPIL
jgi:hypothetical protein